MDNEELEEWIESVSACIREEYSGCRKRERKFEKTIQPLLALLESRGYNPAVIRYSKLALPVELSRLETEEVGANSVANEEAMQMDTIIGNIYPKSQFCGAEQSYKELLEEIVNEPIDPNSLPVPWLLEDSSLEQMQSSASRFREALKQFPDSDSEVAQSAQKEAANPVKGKPGRPRGSARREKLKAAVSNENEDEKELLENFRRIKDHIRKSSAPSKMRKVIGIFGIGTLNGKGSDIAPELRERLCRAAEFLD